jgi:pimeloyl-ACP methyl ester carboxylesterase
MLEGQPLAYKSWGSTSCARNNSTQETIVALHGWLDNAASFDLLAPLLAEEHRVIAVDLAGHGLSYHRSRDSGYNIWQDLRDIDALVEFLGLEHFILMGHSRGAIISSLYAATLPQQVKSCILLDGFLPEPVVPENAPRQMAQALADSRVLTSKHSRRYPSRREALGARMRGSLALSEDAATLIANRGLTAKDGTYFWRSDMRLKGASEVKFSSEHCKAFAESIRCPALLLKAKDRGVEVDSQLLAAVPNLEFRELPGGHHFHLEANSHQAVAAEILKFIAA